MRRSSRATGPFLLRFAKSRGDLFEDAIDLLISDFHLRQSCFRRGTGEPLGGFCYQRFSAFAELLDLCVDVQN